jgi:type II secretory pathway pseudopilin PulG
MFRNMSRKTEYTIAVIVIVLLLVPLLIFMLPAIERAKVKQVNIDLRQIATALEMRYVDMSQYPYTENCFKTGEMYLNEYHENFIKDDYEEIVKGAYILSPKSTRAFRRKYGHYKDWLFRDYAILTTPIEYISTIPKDPFSREGNRHYRYGISPRYWPWILVSNGPDGDEDLGINRFCLDSGRQTAPNFHDSVYYGYDKPLTEYMYDPTNGAKSNGDIIRLKQ